MLDLDIPVLDFADATGGAASFPRELVDAMAQYGFVALVNHGLGAELLPACYAEAEAFFAQPTAAKRPWERPENGRQRGYTGFGVEHAKDRGVHDLKEFWQVGLSPATGGLPDNVVPDAPATFAPRMETLFQALYGVAATMFDGLRTGLGLDHLDPDDVLAHSNSVLRVIHYPPIRDTDPTDAVRAAAHEDINLLTVLPASTQPGLELLDRQGRWRPIRTPDDVLIVDTGDMFAYLTGGHLPATTHRVVNPPGGANVSRYSMPFFLHPRPDWVIEPISGDAPPIVSGDYLVQRLRENRVL